MESTEATKPYNLANCPVCQASTCYLPFEKHQRNNTIFELSLCPECGCIINSVAYDALEQASVEKIQETDYYSVEDRTVDSLLSEIDSKENMIRFLTREIEGINRLKSFCDFGTGSGTTAAAASRIFPIVYGVDYDLRGPNELTQRVQLEDRVIWVDSLKSIKSKIDIVMMWHVLEHLPSPHTLLSEIKARLSDEGYLFIQVPLYRPQHLEICHFVFFTHSSIMKLLGACGFSIENIEFDYSNGFMTAIARS